MVICDLMICRKEDTSSNAEFKDLNGSSTDVVSVCACLAFGSDIHVNHLHLEISTCQWSVAIPSPTPVESAEKGAHAALRCVPVEHFSGA